MAANRPRKHGPNSQMASEKAKDFGKAIKRLIEELKSFHKLIALALVLAAAGSILSIFTPNILSDMTDKISEGLVINSKNLNTLTTEIANQLSEEKLASIIPEIIDLNLSEKNIENTLLSKDLSRKRRI